jgi:hypothetical protein
MTSPPTNELSFRHFAHLVRRGWRLLLLCAGTMLVIAVLAMLAIEPRYTIAMRVGALPEQNNANPLSGLGGSAGLRLLTGSDQSNHEFQRYQGTLTTVELGTRLMRHQDLMMKAFPGAWDPRSRSYLPRKRILGPLYALFGNPAEVSFTPTTVTDYINANVRVVQPEDDTSIVMITMTSPDPAFAKQLLSAMHFEATDILRQNSSKRANKMLGYLRARLTTLTVQDYRESILQLISQQESMRLLSEPGVSYAAEILDSPYSSDLPTFPRVIIFLFVAAILGLGLGSVLIVLVDAFGIAVDRPLFRLRRTNPTHRAGTGI